MVMSSFLMNSSPAAYAAADPKFPPTEEYSQGNYIPDYYGQPPQPPPHQTTGHYGYHHHHLYHGAPTLDQQSATQPSHHYGHHVPTHHGQYYSPCTAPLGPHPGGPVQQHPGTPVHHLSAQHVVGLSQQRVPSPPQLQRSPSPRSQGLGVLGEPPSPSDCIGSGSDSGAGPNPVIYPWMKKVHVNQAGEQGACPLRAIAAILCCALRATTAAETRVS